MPSIAVDAFPIVIVPTPYLTSLVDKRTAFK